PVLEKALQRVIVVFATTTRQEVARRNSIAKISAEFELVPASGPAHIVHELINVRDTALRRIPVRSDDQTQFIDVDVWEVALRVICKLGRYGDRKDLPTIAKTELIEQVAGEVVDLG